MIDKKAGIWFSGLGVSAVAAVVIGVVALSVIWLTTLKLAAVERDAADRAMVASSSELTGTYEAQVTRTLREISQALTLVEHFVASGPEVAVLERLGVDRLLPPSIVFTVAYTDPAGRIIESTRPLPWESVGGHDFFEAQRETGSPLVGLPIPNHATGADELPFTSRIEGDAGEFLGIGIVLLDATHFVDAYVENPSIGKEGFIGLIGADGHVRAMYGQEATGHESASTEVESHLVTARRLLDFPVAAAVGLSRDEWSARADEAIRKYVINAAWASIIVICIMLAFSYMWRLVHRARERIWRAQEEHAEIIEHMAFHDALTGLPNRAHFTRRLEQALSPDRRRSARSTAVLLLDLDRFKVVNDTLGHSSGDELLRQVGGRLLQALRGSDFVARLGGDEFVVLVPEVTAREEIGMLANRILKVVSEPIVVAGREIRVTASIGISVSPDDGADEESLLKFADIAMYQAKNAGKNAFALYSVSADANASDRLETEAALTRAIENDEFVLHYQARVDSRDGRVRGVEALIRWVRPGIGMVPPMTFIPVAEETGQIVEIGRWVLAEACRQCAEWQHSVAPGLRVSVNISPRQFSESGLIDDIRAALAASGLDPSSLEVEITESMLMRDVGKATEVIAEIRSLGIRTSIDDFGTGYSSLSMLKQFPLDVIKIDGSFVRGALESEQDRTLTEAVIAVGRALNLKVVAEGVETSAHAEFLRARNCDELQGYFINRPAPAREFRKLLEAWVDHPAFPARPFSAIGAGADATRLPAQTTRS